MTDVRVTVLVTPGCDTETVLTSVRTLPCSETVLVTTESLCRSVTVRTLDTVLVPPDLVDWTVLPGLGT